MSLIPLEEYAEQHNLDPNYLNLLVAAGRLPHKRQLGRVNVDGRVLDEPEEELWPQEPAFEKLKR